MIVEVALAGVRPAEDLVHVQDEDGHEGVEADPLPHLGEEDEGQALGVVLQHGKTFRMPLMCASILIEFAGGVKQRFLTRN